MIFEEKNILETPSVVSYLDAFLSPSNISKPGKTLKSGYCLVKNSPKQASFAYNRVFFFSWPRFFLPGCLVGFSRSSLRETKI